MIYASYFLFNFDALITIGLINSVILI